MEKKIQQCLRTFFFCKNKRHRQTDLWLLHYLFGELLVHERADLGGPILKIPRCFNVWWWSERLLTLGSTTALSSLLHDFYHHHHPQIILVCIYRVKHAKLIHYHYIQSKLKLTKTCLPAGLELPLPRTLWLLHPLVYIALPCAIPRPWPYGFSSSHRPPVCVHRQLHI
jgi:hypothetical protein